MTEKFSYDELTNRNIGFVTHEEQQALKNATVFICGNGGMGGACVMGLVRAGIGNLILADLDGFEISNMNRQLFAYMHTVDKHKSDATKEICLTINPEMNITVYHADWANYVEEIITKADIIVNGTDDLGASLLLYRTAKAKGKTVIDAYASPLPSIYVTKAGNPMPEERLKYPTIETPWNELSDDQRSQAFMCEAEHVILHSSSRKYINLDLAGEVASGKRSRMSFAPMVISTGMLMSYEVIASILKKPQGADYQGWFFNPYDAKIEKPKNPIFTIILRPIVRRFLTKIMGE